MVDIVQFIITSKVQCDMFRNDIAKVWFCQSFCQYLVKVMS